MRLLERKENGEFSLTKDLINNIPQYAILSHTWGEDDEEVTFKDLIIGAGKSKSGYRKIQFCGEQATRDELYHFWVDTCCIDRSNNTELSEAINSMFRWYRDAAKCYVYLSDVSIDDSDDNDQSFEWTWEPAFRKSRWFTRGWTLQELIAPTSVEFFSAEGKQLGDKILLEQQIHEITGISVQALRGSALSQFPVDERMLWAAKRRTKRKEDEAYCLFGLFNIHMPLIYGEGKDRAFIRLKEEIYKSSRDGIYASQQACQRHRIITDWLSATAFPTQQSDIIARREPGTGQWFLETPQFTRWLCSSKATLFCPGIPGAGKTMMAAITINHLITMQNSSIGLAYIFCNYKAQVEQNITSLLAAILKQLVQDRPSIAEPVSRLYEHHSSQRTRPLLEDVFAVLQTTLKSFSNVYIVVDALDECSNRDGTRSRLLAKLRDLQLEADLRIMATSRFMPDIENEFRSMPTLEVRASNADMKRFLEGQVDHLPNCIKRDDELKGLVQDKIIEAVDGMFLLAHLHVESLLDITTKKEVKSVLNKLSKDSKDPKEPGQVYDEAYNEAIKRIEAQPPRRRALAKSVLSWITYAQRPLTTVELSHALAVELGEEELDQDNIPNIEDAVSFCAGLVTVDEDSNIIRLVHYTTQEYFERIREKWIPCAQLGISLVCLTYLSFNPFQSGSCHSNEEFKNRLERNVFLDYASRYWGQHARTVQEQVFETASLFLQNDNLVSCATQTMLTSPYKYGNYSQNFPRQTTGLHLTAGFGLLYLLQRLLSQSGGFSVDQKDSNGRTPLTYAALRGHEAAAKFLAKLDDVESDSKDRDGRAPLSYAALNGHEAVVKLLIERDNVEADSKDVCGRTPLSYAAERGHRAVVKLLVERGDVEADLKDDRGRTRWDNGGRTPLSYAAGYGHEAVVRLLIERNDVEADSKDACGRTPLSYAAESGHGAVVKLLVERGDVEADLKDERGQMLLGNNGGRTPLSYAAGYGHEAVVRLLIERDDVEADSKDACGRTLLSYVAESGHEAVVKLLVERGDVEADSKDGRGRTTLDNGGRTPLSYAAKYGRETVVRLLIERDDVEADSKDACGRAPLSYAAESGHEAVVKLLVERSDVKADSKDDCGRTPLSYAAGRGHEAVVRLLIERDDVGADSKDEQDEHDLFNIGGRTPVSYAAAGGYETVVKLLLKRDDVEADSKDECSRTPLSYAAASGYEVVVKLLVKRDDVEADSKDEPDLFDNGGRTPLSYAAGHGHETVVRLLTKRDDVEADSKDKCNRTPLSYAAASGHEAVVKLLVERGDVEADSMGRSNLFDDGSRTPLSYAAEGGHEAVVRLLIKRDDVEVDSKDAHNQTPLSYAAASGREAVVKLLISRDDVEADSKDKRDEHDLLYIGGRTPLSYAAEKGHEAVIRLLIERDDVEVDSKDARSRTPLSYAAASGHGAVVKLLISRDDVEADSRDKQDRHHLFYIGGRTPLSYAAEKGHEAVIRLLIKRDDVEINSKDAQSQTPLSYAAASGHETVVKLLAERDDT